MRIGDLAAATDIPQRMLRYYEEQGLIHPGRTANGYRSYTPADVTRARKVRDLIRSGLPTRIIRIVLEMDDDDGTWTQQCSRDFAEELAEELTDLERRIGCLTSSRDTVRGFLERTRHAVDS